MGIWRSTMPLLSTLAALVIIVHSAEEEMSRGYRRDLRPRSVDTASYEQPWKAIDVVPVHQQNRAEAWLDSPEEEPPRRRPVRKRKRRPLSYPDTAPQERHQESIKDFHDPTIDASKRRRKRPEHMNYHFTEQPPVAEDRPLRRRGLRKKRPYYDEQLSIPFDYETEAESLPKFNYPFFDDYDTEHKTDISPTFETETTHRPYNVENELNRIHSNKSILGASESDSTSSVEGDSGVITKNIDDARTGDSRAQSTVDAQSKPDNNSSIDHVHGLINHPEVQKLNLGIIINGTEHSYLPMLIPVDHDYDDDRLTVAFKNKYTGLKNDVFNTKYSNARTKMISPILSPKASVFVPSTVRKENIQPIKVSSYGEKSLQKIITTVDRVLKNITYNNTRSKFNLGNTGKGTNIMSLIKPLQKPLVPKIVLANNTKVLKGLFDDGKFEVTAAQVSTGKPKIYNSYIGSHSVHLPKQILKAFLPYKIRKDNTQLKEKVVHEKKSTQSMSNGSSKNNTESSYGVNNPDFNDKKTTNINVSIPSQSLVLAYGLSKNETEKNKGIKELNQKPMGSTDKDYYSNKLDCIVFPISSTKFVVVYYHLKDRTTNNVKGDLGIGDTEQSRSLPFVKEDKDVTKAKDTAHNICSIFNIPKKMIFSGHATDYFLVDLSNDATDLRNRSVIKNSGIHSKHVYYPNKWISKVNVSIPTLTPEENFEYMPEELQENGMIDPIMLKQLLKRSNGSSLSEILQRHNLSLSDLLQGRNEAISALNTGATYEPQQSYDTSLESNSQLNGAESKYPLRRQASSKERITPTELSSDEDAKGSKNNGNTKNEEPVPRKDVETENQPKISTKQRFPTGIRRKLRMRPTLNSTLKAQLSRDLIALSARKYSNNNRNVTKSREWKDIVPMMPDRSKTEDDENSKDEITELAPTTTDTPIETTTSSLKVSNSSYTRPAGSDVPTVKDNEVENAEITTTEATTTIIIEVLPDEIMSEIEKPKITPIVRPAANNSTLRRQAFNNRLKRKRLKQKSSTTENPSDDLMRNFLGMANLVSASQFVERTQKPLTTVEMTNTEFATELEDFLTAKTPVTVDEGVKSTSRLSTSTTARSLPKTSSTSTTQQTAKFEIQEILNDKMTKERLAKILRERNMTLNELVNHRERGSSHVHLADIFHNASKEPNPPEPFLTKSSIEPISKEMYPLRAILEANTYETTTRTVSWHADQKNIQVPVAMNFGNNVNENGESMGIISLFNKLAENEVTIDKAEVRKDSNGTPYMSSVVSVNATNDNDTRESRVLGDSEDWNELLTFMKTNNITTFEEDLQTLNKGGMEKDSLEDLDANGLMLLDDLQHLQNFESNVASGSDENKETSMHERRENLSEKPGILNKLPNNTKSVAIATASILGLGAILFLLTYIAFKWKQQRNKLRKKESFCDGPIPSPVFEKRKGHKNNCSSRSISPMISNTNIYMSTLETNGKESPDYMWNSLRKPFQ